MEKMLFQLQIVDSIQKDNSNRHIFTSSLLAIKPSIKEIYDIEEFANHLVEFIKINKLDYLEHLKIGRKLKLPRTDDKLEITYYFTPSSLKKNLLNYQVFIENAKSIFDKNDEILKALAGEIYVHVLDVRKRIVLDNKDQVAEIKLKDYNLL